MMHTIKSKMSAASVALTTGDINITLRSVTRYAWLAAAGLFVSYLYFVGAITFSVIKQESLARAIKATISETSREELTYLTLQKGLTEDRAKERGFVSASEISYTASQGAFAWNLDGRE